MSIKIIVAGGGHGGLIAAAKLAKAGYNVTVYEKLSRADVGHDWEDRFDFQTVLSAVEASEMPEGSWRYRGNTEFVSPSKRTEIKIEFSGDSRQKVMWRKQLAAMLLDYAESCGVKLLFERAVLGPIIEGGRIVGIKTDGGEVFGDRRLCGGRRQRIYDDSDERHGH